MCPCISHLWGEVGVGSPERGERGEPEEVGRSPAPGLGGTWGAAIGAVAPEAAFRAVTGVVVISSSGEGVLAGGAGVGLGRWREKAHPSCWAPTLDAFNSQLPSSLLRGDWEPRASNPRLPTKACVGPEQVT